jgi:hypothetical protein
MFQIMNEEQVKETLKGLNARGTIARAFLAVLDQHLETWRTGAIAPAPPNRDYSAGAAYGLELTRSAILDMLSPGEADESALLSKPATKKARWQFWPWHRKTYAQK